MISEVVIWERAFKEGINYGLDTAAQIVQGYALATGTSLEGLVRMLEHRKKTEKRKRKLDVAVTGGSR